jgi:hypothetical protein
MELIPTDLFLPCPKDNNLLRLSNSPKVKEMEEPLETNNHPNNKEVQDLR